MPNRHATGNRDRNEKLITPVITAAGKNYIQLHEGDGADLLVIDTDMYFIEIKRDDLPPSKTQLTPSEKVLQALCKMLGIEYYIVYSPEQMVDILNARTRAGG